MRCSGTLKIWTQSKKFEFEHLWRGVFWGTSDLDSEEKVRWGGGVLDQITEEGCSCQFGQKILEA